jgi:hypothetical protein
MTKLAAAAVAVVAAVALAPRADAWTISQNFDSSSVGSSCGWDAGGGSTVTNAQHYTGSNSCKLTITSGSTAYGMWGGVLHHPTPVTRGGQIWFRVHTLMPAGFNYNSYGEGNHLKFFRFHTATTSAGNAGYDDIYINPTGNPNPFQFIYEGEQVWDLIGSATGTLAGNLMGTNKDAIQLGVWETYEYWVKFDTASVKSGGQAEVRFWKNGALMADLTDRITLGNSSLVVDQTNLFTYWNGGAPATQSMYVDDVVLTTDTPTGRDAAGHPFVGVGGAQIVPPTGGGGGTTAAVPNPPSSVAVN